MLDQTTKRKIDNARDILVGKVPDPKSQVEQITIALIYKFMDDMDKESEEMGGKATFFTGEYEKYAWSRIFDPRLGGFDLINTYSDAIIKMNHNPNIPQLFRDIFKNAYLPYRDPETLKSFLKEINEFHYDHSERLGDAFEYLLSVLGSQGEAGQFRTPRHIIDFIVSVVDPKKNNTIADPACGTAGFLISSYKHILKQNTKKRNGDKLTPDERKRLLNNLVGYDISPDMVRLSLVNMYLHEFPDPKIHEYDTLTSEDRWNETFDVILANPPFMSPKGGIRPHKRFSIQAKRSEVLFVDYIAEHLNPNGRAGVIVPEGVIFQSGTAYKQLRKMLVEDYLWAVVSLPAGVFNPYSGVRTSILFIDKTLQKKTDKILFVKIKNDGFDLGAQRRPSDKNDLPRALNFIKSYHQAVINGNEVENTDFTQVVKKAKILNTNDYSLDGARHKEYIQLSGSKYDLSKLREVCEINPSKAEVKDLDSNTEVSFVPMADLNVNTSEYLPKEVRKISKVFKGYTYFKENDILLAKITPCFENGKSGISKNLVNCIGFGSTEFIVLRPSDRVIPEWIYFIISSEKFIKTGKENMTGSAGQQRVPVEFVKEFLIPIPPIEIQNEIVSEGMYQKIIDGAKQVVDNYKPTFKIDPNWEIVELGEVLSFVSSGATPKGGKEVYSKEGILFIRSQNILVGEYDFSDAVYISEEIHRQMGRSKTKQGDVFLNITGASIGRSAYMDLDIEANVNQHVAILRTTNKLQPQYLQHFLNSSNGQLQILNFQAGASREALNYSQIKQLRLPLPNLETQNRIVSQIETELEIVNANKKLITIYEQKIKDKLSEVWGDSKK